MNYKTLVFGCSGTIGLEFINVNKNKNILYYSRKKPKKVSKTLWRYVDLNKKINDVPKKANIELCSAAGSVYYNLSNSELHQSKDGDFYYWNDRGSKGLSFRKNNWKCYFWRL